MEGADPAPEERIALDGHHGFVGAPDLVDEEQIDAGHERHRQAEGGERTRPVERVVGGRVDAVEDTIHTRHDGGERTGPAGPPDVGTDLDLTGREHAPVRAAGDSRAPRRREDC